MPIGTSTGEYFEDAYAHAEAMHVNKESGISIKPVVDKKASDAAEMAANETTGSFYNRFDPAEYKPLTPYSMGPQGLPEPTGALKSTGGTETPGFFSRLSLVNAFKGMVGGAGEAVKNLPENFVKNVKALGETAALPHDVMTGDVPSGSVQEVEKAADLAMLMVGAPAPVAAKMADGTLGSFMGVKSKTFDQAKALKASQMESKGIDPDVAYASTATFRGADTQWRQEINDSAMKLKDEAFEHSTFPTGEHTVRIKPNTTVVPAPKDNTSEEFLKWFKGVSEKRKPLALEDVIHHPELFEAYPELRGKIKVHDLPIELGGWDPATGKGSLGMMRGNDLYLARDMDYKLAKNIMMHEIQHTIQDIEGFARGGSPEEFRPPKLDAAEEYFNKVRAQTEKELEATGYSKEQQDILKQGLRAELEGMASPEVIEQINRAREHPMIGKLSNIVKSEKLLDEARAEHHALYSKIMGEVESRNVEARLTYDKALRNMISPRHTEDVPREFQIPIDPVPGLSYKSEPIPFRRGANDNTPGLYNPREPNMIGSKEMDDRMEATWKKFGEDAKATQHLFDQRLELLNKTQSTGMSEFELAKYNKLGRAEAEITGIPWKDWTEKPSSETIQYQLRKEREAIMEDKRVQMNELMSKSDFNSADSKLVKKLMKEHEDLAELNKR